jgi:hypothetical protein
MPGDWTEITTVAGAPLQIAYPWHYVWELDDQYARLRFEADGEWACLGAAVQPCGPDGHQGLPWPSDRLLVAKSAPGALIGKLGGSTAGNDDGTVFTIGSRTIVSIDQKKNGFLYIGVNGALPGASNALTRIRLQIFGAADQ